MSCWQVQLYGLIFFIGSEEMKGGAKLKSMPLAFHRYFSPRPYETEIGGGERGIDEEVEEEQELNMNKEIDCASH